MATTEELMNTWKDGNYVNVDSLEAAHQVVTELIAKVTQLEQRIATIEALVG